jgi:hypothetical protein
MSRACEVCENLESRRTDAGRRVRRVLIEQRIVCLCDEHAAEYRLSGARSLAELFVLFSEAAGHRSLLSRRSPLDRRIFPARPEGRRRGAGRRASDRGD